MKAHAVTISQSISTSRRFDLRKTYSNDYALVAPIRHFNLHFNDNPPIQILYALHPPTAPSPSAMSKPTLRHTPMLATQHVFYAVRVHSQSSLGVLRSPGVWATCQDV